MASTAVTTEPHDQLTHTHGRVVVVGSVNEDTVIATARLPRPGETVAGDSRTLIPGGKGANQAVAAARAGAAVEFIGAIGADDAGQRSLQALIEEGVSATHVLRLESTETGTATIVVDRNGENQITIVSGANGALGAGHVETALASLKLTEADVCLISFEIGDGAIRAAAQCAARAGCTLVVNPAPARSLPDDLVITRPILVPNATEAELLTGLSNPRSAALQLHTVTGAPVLVSVGGDGAWVVTSKDAYLVPARQVDVTDTTGAGDTLLGFFCAGLVRRLPLEEAVARAVEAATVSVTTRGARSAPSTCSATICPPIPMS